MSFLPSSEHRHAIKKWTFLPVFTTVRSVLSSRIRQLSWISQHHSNHLHTKYVYFVQVIKFYILYFICSIKSINLTQSINVSIL